MAFVRFGCFVSLLSTFTIGGIKGFDFDVCKQKFGGGVQITFKALKAKTPVVVNCGSSYPVNEFTSPPTTISFGNADESLLYEVLMFDPDAPSKVSHKCRSWVHLVMSNVLGKDLRHGISGENKRYVVTEYYPPTPPKGTGYHRYVFAVFSHKKPLELKPLSDRCGMEIEKFATENRLSTSPDASNMFRTKSSETIT